MALEFLLFSLQMHLHQFFRKKNNIAKKAFRFKVLLKVSIAFIYTNDILQISTHIQITASD
jgi:hypothetical protein